MFSFNLDVGWGTVLLLLGIPAVLLYLFLAANVIAWDHAKRQAMFVKPDVALLKISGVLRQNARAGSNYRKLMEQIARLRKWKPKSVIVEINSPGGTTAASHEIYEALKSLRDDGIHVVAHMGDVAASGGVYIAMAAEKIVATPGTITGSIGVIVHHFDLSKIIGKFDLKSEHIKSGEHKDIMSMTRPMTDKDKQIMQSAVDDIYQEFCAIIAESRGIPLVDVWKFADGRVFSAAQAKRLRLIDEVGGYATAEKLALKLGDLKKEDARIDEVAPSMTMMERLGILPGVTAITNRFDDLTAVAEMSGVPMSLYK